MTSVIYVDLSSDSEEEGPPGVKRARREQSKSTPSNTVPSKLLHIPKASLTQIPASVIKTSSAGTPSTVVGASYRSMHIPSGITVTKHTNCNGNTNTNNPNAKLSLENNNNNSNNNNNLLKEKSVKLSMGTPSLTSAWSKVPTTLATITSVPVPHPIKLTPASKSLQKATIQVQQQTQKLQQQSQQKAFPPQKPMATVQQKLIQHQQKPMPQLQLQQKSIVSMPQLLLKQQQKVPLLTMQKQQQSTGQPQTKLQTAVQLSMTPKQPVKPKLQQRLPTLQKRPLVLTPTATSTLPQQRPIQVQKQPPPAHCATNLMLHKQKQAATLAPPPPAHAVISSVAILTPPSLAKLTPMPMLSKQGSVMSSSNNNSAARTVPYKSKPTTGNPKATTTAVVTASAVKSVQQLSCSSIQQQQQTIMASATPPLRLLATPPHCAAALNEPLLLNLPPTTSITPQLTPTTTPPPPLQAAPVSAAKISFPAASISPVKLLAKRVQPITVLKKSDDEWRKHVAQQQKQQLDPQQSQKPKESKISTPTPTVVLVESPPTTPPTEKSDIKPTKSKTKLLVTEPGTPTALSDRAPLSEEYSSLLSLCRDLDKSKDMDRLIDAKLIKYYYSVHENFVRSRGFRKQLIQIMERIRTEPDMIYFHLKSIVDELKVRRKAKSVELPQDELVSVVDMSLESANAPVDKAVDAVPTLPPNTGNKRTDERIRKLNRTLYTITKRISALEQAEVDWNDDDSSYLQVERYKKRACQIYEKICDLTGESKTAHRQMKQPILFKDTPYPQFNRTLSAFVNRMHAFPDYHDVLQLLEHCNKEKNLGLATFEMKRIAHDAFVKVGRLLQARRKTDLYETVTHFTANTKDPAVADPNLLAKLNENNKKQTKISDILDKFVREQNLTLEEQREARVKEKLKRFSAAGEASEAIATDGILATSDADKPCTSAQAAKAAQDRIEKPLSAELVLTNGLKERADSGNESDSDEEDEDEESDEDVDTFVDNFKTNGDLSDAESENDTNAAPKTPAADAHVIVNITRDKTAAPNESTQINNDNRDDLDVNDFENAACKAPNGKLKESSIAHTLKVMSVTSLNASVFTNNTNSSPEQPQQQRQQKNIKQKMLIGTEIVISDEES